MNNISTSKLRFLVFLKFLPTIIAIILFYKYEYLLYKLPELIQWLIIIVGFFVVPFILFWIPLFYSNKEIKELEKRKIEKYNEEIDQNLRS